MSPPQHERTQVSDLIDVELMERIRRVRGQSERDLGTSSGLGRHAIARLRSGRGHAELRVRDLFALAQSLGVSPRALIRDQEADEEGRAADDAVVLLAALLEISRPGRMRVSELAASLRWTKRRVQQALDSLSEALRETGAALARTQAGVLVVPRGEILTKRETSALKSARHARRGLNQSHLRLLRKVHCGDFGPHSLERRGQSDFLATLGWLVNHGYIQKTRDGGLELTAETAFSLGLIETKPGGAARRARS